MKLKTLVAAVCAFGLIGGANAAILGEFTVQEGAIAGTTDLEVTGTQYTMRYEASIVQQFNGGTGVTSFVETGYFDGTGIVLGNAAQISYLNSPGGYGLYGLFEISGTISFVGTTALATFTAGWVELWADPDQDTSKSIGAGDSSVTLGGTTTDDMLLASSTTLISGQANVPLIGDQAADGGSYVLDFGMLDLTTLGLAYFIDPVPFYMYVNVSGENETFTPVLTAGNYTGLAEGDGSFGFYQVPEPMSLALVGLGLLGLGAVSRRRSI